MNTLWIIGQFLTFISLICFGLYTFDNHPKRNKIYMIIGIVSMVIYIILFTIRMIQIYDILGPI